jgi:hypothetical protein
MVKPVYNDHTWDPKRVVIFDRRSNVNFMIKFSIGTSNLWSLWTDDRYAEVVVGLGLTVNLVLDS